jgi:hypothetical protein
VVAPQNGTQRDTIASREERTSQTARPPKARGTPYLSIESQDRIICILGVLKGHKAKATGAARFTARHDRR